MRGLSVRDRELFLAEPHIAALSVSAGPGRGPLTVPIWVGVRGLEPRTSSLSGKRSNRLSYTPKAGTRINRR